MRREIVRRGIWAVTLGLSIGVGGLIEGQEFTLGFQGPDKFTAAVGTAVGGEYMCTLTQVGGEVGAQGWSISMVADNATITDITTAGTLAAPVAEGGLQKGGFESVELTPLNNPTTPSVDECAGKAGAVEAIVLSFKLPITLPATGTNAIGKITVESEIPDVPEGQCGSFVLRYANGCRGLGQKVDNNITLEGKTEIPVKGTLAVELCTTPPSCKDPGKINLGFSEARLTSAGIPAGSNPLDAVASGGDGAGEGWGGEIAVNTPTGVTGEKDVFVNIVSNLTEPEAPSVQGWSLSIALDGEAGFSMAVDEFGSLTDVTTAGTSSAPVPDGLQKGGFESVEVVDPALAPTSGPLKGLGPQGQGVVTAIVLSFKLPIVLPPVGAESILKMKLLSEREKEDGVDQVAKLTFKDGLQGAGQPVLNVFTVGGATVAGCNTNVADVTVRFGTFGPPVRFFRRGNANGDAKVNIADPIWIINEVFREGPKSGCEAALDVNGDDMLDASDAVYLIDYLFKGGSPPPAPFGECGEPTGTLTCEVSTDDCV